MADPIVIEIRADGKDAERDLERLATKMRRTTRDMRTEAQRMAGVYTDAAGRWREANGRFVSVARQAELGLQGVGRESQRTAKSFDVLGRSSRGAQSMLRTQARELDRAATSARRYGTVIGAVAAGGIAYAAKEGLQFNATMESNQIALEQLTGSALKADKLLSQLYDTAKRTPFEFADITEASKKFLAFGFSIGETKKTLDAIGNATAALGGGSEKINRLVIAMGQIQAKGRVQGDELLQLAEAGIPAYQILREKLHLTGEEVAKIGTLGIKSSDAISALVDGMNERFAGMTEKQAKSLQGQLSTFRDNRKQMFGAMTEGLFEELKHWAPQVNKTAELITKIWKNDKLSFADKLDLSTKTVETHLGPLFKTIVKAVDDADIPKQIGKAISVGAPKVAAGAATLAKEAAKGFYKAFTESDEVGKLILGGWLLKKGGVFSLLAGMMKGGGKGKIPGLGAQLGSKTSPAYVIALNGGFGGVDVDRRRTSSPNVRRGLGRAAAFGSLGLLVNPQVAATVAATMATGAVLDANSKKNLQHDTGQDTAQRIEKSAKSAKEKVKDLNDELDKLKKKIDANRAYDGKIDFDTVPGGWGMKTRLEELTKQRDAMQVTADAEDRFASRMSQSIERFGSSHKRTLSEVSTQASTNAKKIRDTLGGNTAEGKRLLEANFKAAAAAVKTQMDDAGRKTKAGTDLMNSYLQQAADSVGIKLPKSTRQHLASKAVRDSTDRAARGKLMTLPGSVGPDSIPMNVNGKPIIAAPGEDVAIFTRHQRAFVDKRLADVGGLGGVFRGITTPHNAARYAQGGMVTGDTDYSPALGRKLQQMAGSTNTPIFVQSGGRSIAEQAALYASKGPGNAAAPGPNAPHVRGVAADITPGRERFGGVAGRFGLGFTVGHEPWHIQLINDAVASGKISTGTAEKLKRVMWKGPGGQLGKIGQGGLDRYRTGAQSLLDQAMGSMGGDATGPVPPTGSSGGSEAAKAYALAQLSKYGWGASEFGSLDRLWTGESGWNPNAVNPKSGAAGIPQALGHGHVFVLGDYQAQVDWGLKYIAGRYGSPSKAYQFWLGNNPHWYAQGGIVQAAKGYDSWRERANPTTGSKKPPKPVSNGPGYPNLAKIKGKKTTTAAKKWKSKYLQWLLPSGQDGLAGTNIPDFDRLFETPARSLQNAIDIMQGNHALSDEQAVVSLFNSGSHQDLAAYLAQHPELAKDYGNIDSLDVVNWDGLTVQGKPVPGIRQHVGELEQILNTYAGAADGNGEGGLLGLRIAEYARAGVAHGDVAGGRDKALDALRQVRLAWAHEHARRQFAMKKVAKLQGGGQSWQSRVNDNEARIEAIQDWKRKVDVDTSGKTKTAALQKQLQKADQDIDRLNDENDDLEKDKPGPKTQLSSKATKAQKEKAKRADAMRTKQLGHWTAVQYNSARELDFLVGNRDEWSDLDGVAGQWRNRLDAHNGKLSEIETNMRSLSEVDVPTLRTVIRGIAQERGDWLGTAVSLPSPAGGAAADTGKADQIAALKAQMFDDEQKKRLLAEAQFSIFKGFAPLVGGRMLGSFDKGTLTSVQEGGLARLHKREIVIPDPLGPYGLDQRMGGGGQAPIVNVTLNVAGDAAPLVRLVDARVDGRAARIVSEQLGRQQRILSIAPGGR